MNNNKKKKSDMTLLRDLSTQCYSVSVVEGRQAGGERSSPCASEIRRGQRSKKRKKLMRRGGSVCGGVRPESKRG